MSVWPLDQHTGFSSSKYSWGEQKGTQHLQVITAQTQEIPHWRTI